MFRSPSCPCASSSGSSVPMRSCGHARGSVLKKRDTAMARRKVGPPRGVLRTEATHRGIRHERYHPSPDLEVYVEHYWTVEWNLGRRQHRAETLPHPSVHMVF